MCVALNNIIRRGTGNSKNSITKSLILLDYTFALWRNFVTAKVSKMTVKLYREIIKKTKENWSILKTYI